MGRVPMIEQTNVPREISKRDHHGTTHSPTGATATTAVGATAAGHGSPTESTHGQPAGIRVLPGTTHWGAVPVA